MKRFLVITLLLFVAVPSYTFSQTINATLGGTVSDASGALIPGVMISATNLATGIVTTNVTNEAGAYNFASIQSGTYKVSAELPGFQTQTYNNVVLGVSQQVRLNFALQVGAVSQTVEVSVAADNLIATSSSSVGSVLPDSKIKDLPLIDRNVLSLVSTQPGVQSLGMAGGTLSESAGFAYRPVGVKRPQAEPPDHIRDGRERRVRLYLQGSCMQLPRSHDFDSTRTLLIARRRNNAMPTSPSTPADHTRTAETGNDVPAATLYTASITASAA